MTLMSNLSAVVSQFWGKSQRARTTATCTSGINMTWEEGRCDIRISPICTSKRPSVCRNGLVMSASQTTSKAALGFRPPSRDYPSLCMVQKTGTPRSTQSLGRSFRN